MTGRYSVSDPRAATPMSRLLSAGMEYADAAELHRRATTPEEWVAIAEMLGNRNLERAAQSQDRGHTITAASWFMYASSCYRAAQAVVRDEDPRRIPLYEKLVATFARGGALRDEIYEYVRVEYSHGSVRAWKILPSSTGEPHPVVIVAGGLDGWREEHEYAARALVARGIAVVLMEAPGQGETRLIDGVHLHLGYEEAVSRVIDAALEDPRISAPVGLLGHSFGGRLMLGAALAEDRVVALCVNGGSPRPVEMLERLPDIIGKVKDTFGADDDTEARELLEALTLGPDDLAPLEAALLVLHGDQDRIFLTETARQLEAWVGGSDKSLIVWEDGEHCLYNHPYERDTTIADWFAARLVRQP